MGARSQTGGWGASALLVVCALVATSGRASGAERTEPETPPGVVFLYPSPTAGPRIHEDLIPAVQAHLGAYPVALQSVAVEEPPDTPAALAIAAAHSAWTVLWLSEDETLLFLLSPGLGSAPRERPLAADGGSWVATCEAIGTMTALEVEAALAGPAPGAAVPEATPEPTPIPEPTPPSEPVSSALSEDADAPGERGSGVRLDLRLGWTPSPLSWGGPVLQGVEVAFAARFGRFVGVELGGDLTSPIPLEPGGGRAVRVPLRLVATGTAAVGRFEPTLGLGVGLEVFRIVALHPTPADSSVLEPRLSPFFVANLRAAVRVTPWLRPYVLAGVDVPGRGLELTRFDEVLARRDGVVLQVSVGVTLGGAVVQP